MHIRTHDKWGNDFLYTKKEFEEKDFTHSFFLGGKFGSQIILNEL